MDRFFEDAYQSLLDSELMSPEFFRGFCIEVLSTLIHILKTNDVDERAIFGDYESLYRNLFNQKTPRNAMEWMKRLAKEVIRILSRERQTESITDRAVRYVNRNYAEPLSLKVLSCAFGLSAPYLGRLFHRAVGKSFTTYLNELRLRKSEELLRYTSLKTSEIASADRLHERELLLHPLQEIQGLLPLGIEVEGMPGRGRGGAPAHSLERKSQFLKLRRR